jgi:hypothetical protein
MSYFIRNGNTFSVADEKALDIHDLLPAGNYTVKKDPMGNFYLEMVDVFAQVPKLYGNTTRHANRIINTFLDRDSATGVLLNGEKGSGKSLLAKTISIECNKQNIPTIIINTPWTGDTFNKLIQNIIQPCVILFDEFEKVYPREEQEAILTLLDGVFPSKKLFILTCNDKYRVDSHMKNRPGRIFYLLDFKGLDQDFIEEYCRDTLHHHLQVHIDRICKIASIFDQFNFDMLKALVEDMNRYNESPDTTLELLNAKPEYSDGTQYDYVISYDSQEIRKGLWRGNPIMPDKNNHSYLSFDVKLPIKDEDGDSIYMDVDFEPSDLVEIAPGGEKYVFKIPEDAKEKEFMLILTKQQQKSFNWAMV